MRNFILIITVLIPLFSFSQTSVKGRVLDSNNFPLPGATIIASSSNEVAITDFNGFFSLFITGSDDLTVKYVGFESLTLNVSESDDLPIFILTPNVTELSEVIVSGFQGGTIKSLNKQRNDINVTNIVSADQVGKFPDANIGDALKRIPGISMQSDQGEARAINIRGFGAALNSVTINGERIPSAEGDNRNVQLDLIPSDMIQAIEVSKTLTPDMEADAIGGSVNLVTRSKPEEFRLSTTISGGSSPIRDDSYNTQFSFILADKLSDRLSYSLSGSRNINDYGSDNIEFVWNESGDDYQINEMDMRVYDVKRQRESISLNLDYQINSNNSIYVQSIYNERHDWENRWRLRLDDPGDKGAGTYRVRKLTKGGIGNDTNDNTRLELQKMWNVAVGGDHTFGKLAVNWKISQSEASEERPDERYLRFDQKGVNVDFDLTNPRFPRPIFADGNWDTPSLAEIKEATFQNGFTEELNTSYKIDFSLPYNVNDKLKFGFKYQEKEKERLNDFYEYDIESDLGIETMDQVPFNNPTPRNFIPGPQYNSGLFPTVEYLGSLTMNEGNSEPVFEEFAAANYMAEETVTSAYIMAVDKLSDNTTIILGARLEATDISYLGASFDVETGESYDDIEIIEGSNDYINILPNLTIQTKLSDNFILNGAYTQSLARPGYYALTPYEDINSDDMEISVGNPDLEATVSNNLDLMAEYYFGPLGLFSAGFFYKNIDNWLYEFTDNNYTWNGMSGFDYSQVRNGRNAEVTGFEFALQTSLTDNVTLYSNYTYTDSKTDGIEGRSDAPLVGAVKNMFNGSLAYESDRLFIRASLNYSDASADELGSESWEDRYYDDQVFVDLNASYSLSPTVKLFTEFKNLTNQPLRYYQGIQSRTMQLEYYSYNWNIGLKIDL